MRSSVRPYARENVVRIGTVARIRDANQAPDDAGEVRDGKVIMGVGAGHLLRHVAIRRDHREVRQKFQIEASKLEVS